jgi:benzoyl-CoA reductase/2-hydroxyglutaryl-CoA dehydratase subunit BcrC/BadD/HgdB
MHPDDFWKNTLNENIRFSEAHQIKENLEWERTRYIATMLVNVNAKKSHQRIQPKKLFKLPQDKKESKGKEYSHKEMREFAKQVEQLQAEGKFKEAK